MKRVLTALILAPLALALVFLGPKWAVSVGVAGVAILSGWEFVGLTEQRDAKPPRLLIGLSLATLFAVNYQWPDLTLTVFGALCILLIAWCTFFSPPARVLMDVTSSVFALAYVGLTLLSIPVLREQPNGPTLVVFLLFVVWAGDIFALYMGRTFGRRKLAPRLSPSKTWAGAIGSLLGSLLVTGGLFALADQLAQWDFVRLSFNDEVWWYWVILAVVVNIAAQIGDLAESAMKRSAGVKDSGRLLPGHGGVLDRIDALLLAAPALWYAQIIHLQF
jgi:phosphatidate cytidylyltransferase